MRPWSLSGLASLCFAVGLLLMPFSTPPSGVGVIAAGLPVLVVPALIWVAAFLLRPAMPRAYGPAALAGFLLASSIVVSSLYAPQLVATLARALPNVLGFLLFLYALSPVFAGPPGTRRVHDRLLVLLVASAVMLVVYFLAVFALAVSRVGLAAVLVDRVIGGVMSLPWGASNTVVSILIFPFFLALYKTQEAGTPRGRYWAALVLMAAAVAASQSRGTILAIAFGFLLVGVLGDPRQRRRLVGLAVLCVGLAVGLQLVIGGESLVGILLESVAGRFGDEQVRSLNNRRDIWVAEWQRIADAPLLGRGYYSMIPLYSGTAHNVVLTTWVERGTIGLLLSSAVVLVAAWRLVTGYLSAVDVRHRRLFAHAIAAGAASLLHLMVEDANLTQPYIIYSWLYLAFAFSASAELGREGAAVRAHRRAVSLRPVEA